MRIVNLRHLAKGNYEQGEDLEESTRTEPILNPV